MRNMENMKLTIGMSTSQREMERRVVAARTQRNTARRRTKNDDSERVVGEWMAHVLELAWLSWCEIMRRPP